MTGPGDSADGIFGEAVEDVALALGDAVDADPGEIESTLRTVGDDGVVTAGSVDDAVGDASLALSTAEGRVEYATVEIERARTAVRDAPESEYLSARAATLEDRRQSLADERDRLQSDLRAAVEQRGNPDALYDLARELQRLVTAADALQGRADQVAADADDLAQFVEQPALALSAVEADLGALETAVEETTAALETLADAPPESPQAAWFEVWTDHQFRRLALEDVGAELDALGTLHDEEEVSALDRRREALAGRWRRIDDRLAEAVPTDWVAGNEQRMQAVREAVDGFEPPIDWGAVEERREELPGGGRSDGDQ